MTRPVIQEAKVAPMRALIETLIRSAFLSGAIAPIPETKIPTEENIVVFIFNALRPNLNSEHQLSVTLYETPRNFVSYSG